MVQLTPCFAVPLSKTMMIIEFSYVVYYLLGKHSGAAKTKIIGTHCEKRDFAMQHACMCSFCGDCWHVKYSALRQNGNEGGFLPQLISLWLLSSRTPLPNIMVQKALLFDSEVHIYPAWTWLDSSQLRKMPFSPKRLCWDFSFLSQSSWHAKDLFCRQSRVAVVVTWLQERIHAEISISTYSARHRNS